MYELIIFLDHRGKEREMLYFTERLEMTHSSKWCKNADHTEKDSFPLSIEEFCFCQASEIKKHGLKYWKLVKDSVYRLS